MEREQVDPADVASTVDPHLAGDQPARRLEPALHVRRAHRVERVPPAWTIEGRLAAADDVDIDVEPAQERCDDIEGRVRDSRFHSLDHLA